VLNETKHIAHDLAKLETPVDRGRLWRICLIRCVAHRLLWSTGPLLPRQTRWTCRPKHSTQNHCLPTLSILFLYLLLLAPVVSVAPCSCAVSLLSRELPIPHHHSYQANKRNGTSKATLLSTPLVGIEFQGDVRLYNYNVRLLSFPYRTFRSVKSWSSSPHLVVHSTYLNTVNMEDLKRPCTLDQTLLETSTCQIESSGLAKPESTYKSPLQKLGEALRTPRPPATPHTNLLDPTIFRIPRKQDQYFSLTTSLSKLQVHLRNERPRPNVPNYSHQRSAGNRNSRTAVSQPGPLASQKANRSSGGEDMTNGIPDATQTEQRISTSHERAESISLHSTVLSRNPRSRPSFKPQRSSRGTSTWQLKQYAEATLGSGSLRKAVKLPEGEDRDEWLAVNGKFYSLISRGIIANWCRIGHS
jgi:hypothetical protein